MKYKKVMAILLALICTAAIALGGCSTHSQETDTLHSSVSEQNKNNFSVGTPKDGKKSQDSLSGSDNTETDAKVKNDNANITSDNSASGKASSNSSSGKVSGNSSSGKASSNSGSGSSTSNNGSSKTSGSSSSSKASGSSSSSKASGSSGAKQPSSNSGTSTSNKTSASHSGSSSSSSSSGNSSKPSKPAQPVHHHNWVQHYTTKTIPEVSHYEEVKKYVCNGCGAQFDTANDVATHITNDFWDDCENYTYKVVDSHKVVDQPAQTVKVPDYKYCTGCGARQ